jgi:hypothetical protein
VAVDDGLPKSLASKYFEPLLVVPFRVSLFVPPLIKVFLVLTLAVFVVKQGA